LHNQLFWPKNGNQCLLKEIINHLFCCHFLLELTFPTQNQSFIQQACFYFRKEKFYQEEEGRINRKLSKARKICGIVDRWIFLAVPFLFSPASIKARTCCSCCCCSDKNVTTPESFSFQNYVECDLMLCWYWSLGLMNIHQRT